MSPGQYSLVNIVPLSELCPPMRAPPNLSMELRMPTIKDSCGVEALNCCTVKNRIGISPSMTLKEVPVFCICRLPWNKDSTAHFARGALVQCALCKEWYHQLCYQIIIDDVVFFYTSNYKYLCT